MLAEPALNVAELAERLGISQAEVRTSLDRLADLALLRASREAPGTLRPVHPERGLQILLRRQEEWLEQQRREIEAGKAAMLSLAEEAAVAEPVEPQTRKLLGLDAIQTELEKLTTQASMEVMTV